VPDPKDEPKQEESFRVVDRRLFTAEGDLRSGAMEQERLEERREQERAAVQAAAAAAASKPAAAPAKAPEPAVIAPGGSTLPAQPAAAPDALPPGIEPAPSRGFQILVDFIAGNAAARLGMLPDPQSGQAYLDMEGANELIDMLDALREKTKGNLAREEEQLLFEVLRSLKLSYLEMSKAATQAMREKAKGKA
jgi:hypothetical protein